MTSRDLPLFLFSAVYGGCLLAGIFLPWLNGWPSVSIAVGLVGAGVPAAYLGVDFLNRWDERERAAKTSSGPKLPWEHASADAE
jgi:hypothetical protein